MKKILNVVLCMMILTGVSGCTKQASTTESTASTEPSSATSYKYEESITNYVNAIDMDYAYSLAETLSTDTSMHDNELGFRTSGSAAENKAAEFIASEMEKIGLQNVTLDPITVDKWQFNGAKLTLDGVNLALSPVSYMVNGTDSEGITAEIVDCGTGFASDYEDKDVEGKIALVGVDQYNESWIDGYMYEAYEHGAVALVTYDLDGYGRYSDDNHQIQDVCAEDVMPTVIITMNEYKKLSAEIEKGYNICTLTVDSEMAINEGTSYNVVGYIPGKNHDQQIIFAGHYDMYFTGFQDDCSAIATAMAMAKAMIDSGYEPENDIVVVAHGAEEWGASGTEYDWTRGAYECIYNTHPDWASKTLALFNFELSAFDDGNDTFVVSSVPEYSSFVSDMVNEGILDEAVKEYGNGIEAETYDTTTMEDGVTYRGAGVPYFLNTTDTCIDAGDSDTYSWTELHYHTESDDTSTYDEKTMKGNIGVYGSLAIMLDTLPALPLDFTRTSSDLGTTFNEDYATEAGLDLDAWNTALGNFTKYAEELKTEGEDINTRYLNASDEEKETIRKEGISYNQKVLGVFKAVQDNFVGIEFSSNIVMKHEGYLNNLYILDEVIEALNHGELTNDTETGALDVAYGLNALTEYNYYLFSYNAVQKIEAHVDASNDNNKWWGNNKAFVLVHTGSATESLLNKENGDDFSEELAIYEAERNKQLELFASTVKEEIEGMTEIVSE